MVKPGKICYVDTKELEDVWARWLATSCPVAWDKLQGDIYKICQGVVVHFNPKDEDEQMDLCHETFALTIEKIKSRKLVFEAGKAPVFNLLTTTIFRHLYSLKNRDNRRRKLLQSKYLLRPGKLDQLVASAGMNGDVAELHPDHSAIKSGILAQLESEKQAIDPTEELVRSIKTSKRRPVKTQT